MDAGGACDDHDRYFARACHRTPVTASGSLVSAEIHPSQLLQHAEGELRAARRQMLDTVGRVAELDQQKAADPPATLLQVAWATLVYNPNEAPAPRLRDDQQLRNALGLANSLRAIESAHPLLLLTNYQEHEMRPLADLDALRVSLVHIHAVPQPDGFAAVAKTWDRLRARWTAAFNKLAAWQLTGWSRLIFMDADAIVTRSIDWRFSRPLPWSAQEVFDPPLRSTASRRRTPQQASRCAPVGPVCRRSAAGWGYAGFGNSGLFGLEPSNRTYRDLLSFLRSSNVSVVLAGGDQQLLAGYFAERHPPGPAMLEPWVASMGHCAHSSNRPMLLSGYRACVGNVPDEVGHLNPNASLHAAYSHKPERGPAPQPAYAAASRCIGTITALGAGHSLRPSSLEADGAMRAACSAVVGAAIVAAQPAAARRGFSRASEGRSGSTGRICAIL
eukprot:2315382-Prymnesium_polylepis.1